MGVLLKSYMGVWKRQLYGLVKRFCVPLEVYMGVSKRPYLPVSTQPYDDVLPHLHRCVLQRRPLIVAERRLYGHRKPDFHFIAYDIGRIRSKCQFNSNIPKQNKAVYTYRWAWTVRRWAWWTNGWTNGPTDRPTTRVACMRLKRYEI